MLSYFQNSFTVRLRSKFRDIASVLRRPDNTSVLWLNASVSGLTTWCTFLGLPAVASHNKMTYCDVQAVGAVRMEGFLVWGLKKMLFCVLLL